MGHNQLTFGYASVFGRAFFVALLALLFPLLTHAGFGVSPSLIQEDNLVPGASLERTFYLVQGTPVGNLDVEIVVESEKAKDWFTVKNAQNNIVQIPDGIQQFPVTMEINIPKDAELGVYKAFVRANTLPASSGGQVTIALAAKTAFNLVVGDNVVSEYEVRELSIPNIEEGEKPKVELIVNNTGNVSAGPSDATFELFNKFGDLRLAFTQVNNITEEVKSFSEDTILLEFPLDIQIGIGEYWGHVKIYDEDVLVKEMKTVFEVTESTAINIVEDIAPEAVVAAAGQARVFGEQFGIPPIALIAGGAVLGIFVLLILRAIIKKLFRKKPRKVSRKRSTPVQQRGPYDAQNNVVLKRRR